MEAWIAGHWFDIVQSAGIIGSLLVSAYVTRKDEKARKIENLIAVNERYGQLWRELYEKPELARVLKKDVDLVKDPVSDREFLFVKSLILHLDSVRRAMKHGEFVRLAGVRKDTEDFFALPIPRAVWNAIQPFQDKDFISFVNGSATQS